MNEIEILRAGYRQLGGKFDDWRDRIVDDPRAEWRDLLASKLDPGARVLELGCGAGNQGLAFGRNAPAAAPDMRGRGTWALDPAGARRRRAQLVCDAGFEIVRDELVRLREPDVDGDGRFQWILARR